MALKPLPQRIGPHAEEGALAAWAANATTLIKEFVAFRAAFETAYADGLLAIATLAIDSTAEEFQTTTTAYYRIGGIQYSKAATADLTFSAAHVVSAAKFGVILVQINAAGTVSTKVPLATQAYDSAALALAALPSADANNVALGYIAIEADGEWTANTDDLTDASDVTTATFNDATPITAFSLPAYEADTLTTERG